jgi:hypothetical protein
VVHQRSLAGFFLFAHSNSNAECVPRHGWVRFSNTNCVLADIVGNWRLSIHTNSRPSIAKKTTRTCPGWFQREVQWKTIGGTQTHLGVLQFMRNSFGNTSGTPTVNPPSTYPMVSHRTESSQRNDLPDLGDCSCWWLPCQVPGATVVWFWSSLRYRRTGRECRRSKAVVTDGEGSVRRLNDHGNENSSRGC